MTWCFADGFDEWSQTEEERREYGSKASELERTGILALSIVGRKSEALFDSLS